MEIIAPDPIKYGLLNGLHSSRVYGWAWAVRFTTDLFSNDLLLFLDDYLSELNSFDGRCPHELRRPSSST